MGVTSCGKSSVGKMLAAELGAPFVEGDALHPTANIEKMSKGIPLNDADRWPWLTRIGEALRGEGACVATCSSLKKSYRQHLIEAAGRSITFVFLNGTRDVLAARIAARKNHFMPSSLLDSQLATLEIPTSEEGAVECSIDLPVEKIVAEALAQLSKRSAS
jgi:gluconokinase